MKIVGFGDSFIQRNSSIEHQYMKLTSGHFLASYETFGVPGSGVWDAFFEFKNKKNDAKLGLIDDFDTVVFVWSESSRIYHPIVRNITYANVLNHEYSSDPIWVAAKYYYEHLHVSEKVNYEITAFFYWLDDWLYENYPNMKFIHMSGFPKHNGDASIDYYDVIKYNPNKLPYFHTWKNSVEIRPPLLHFSMNDDWPGDLSKEHRFQHLSRDMHNKVSELIIDAIENYEPGKIIEYKYVIPEKEKNLIEKLKKLF